MCPAQLRVLAVVLMSWIRQADKSVLNRIPCRRSGVAMSRVRVGSSRRFLEGVGALVSRCLQVQVPHQVRLST
ncbi:hypothetical protein B0T18DRAFT_419756 [Schizothecium vesticola]|uniref:Secreted protein n=1 Tax=Schizothecium vesticola TaxID=314040 RepID=A0AA40K0E5_9PEZI|nr:hypothetical protein B0T18DRAFT_419756 [Schizothecium vesticola]